MARRKNTEQKAWDAAREADEAEAMNTRSPSFALKPYEPPPGVVGKGSNAPTMAMDSQLGGSGYALEQFRQTPLGQMFSEGIGFPGYAYLSALSLRGEYRNIVETIAREVTRKWGNFKSRDGHDKEKESKIKELNNAFHGFKIRELLHEMVRQDGYFGVGHLFIQVGDETNGDELATPLIIDRAKVAKGNLKSFRAVEPMWCTPSAYESVNPLNPWYYRPEVWWVQGQQVHSTRLMQFISRPLPDILKPAYNFGGLPLTMMAKPYVDNFLRTRQSVSDLVHSFSIMVLKTDMEQKIAGIKSRAGNIRQRARLFNTTRDNMGLMLLDNSEEFQNVSAQLGGLDKLQAQSQEHIASICNIPLVKFTGITPSGLNASSDGELRVFYDTMASLRESLLSPAIQKISHIIMLHLWGEIDDDLHFVWDPLFELNDLEKMEVEKSKAEIANANIANGITSNSEERQRMAEDPNSIYSGIDLSGEPPDPFEGEGGGVDPLSDLKAALKAKKSDTDGKV